jgi:RNA polymerase sigma-70 factor, ECF subfamily
MDFDDFFQAEQPKMVALALALTGVPEAACDIAQESLVKAYRMWPAVSVMEHPGGWLRKVTINLAMTWHRSNRREAAARKRLGPRPSVTIPDVEGERFWQAVRDLPGRQRAIVSLYYLEDQSVAAVGAALGIAEGTVKSALFKARATLATALGVAHQEVER